jgi:hypothetical protein
MRSYTTILAAHTLRVVRKRVQQMRFDAIASRSC